MNDTEYSKFIEELPNIFRKDGYLYFKYDKPVKIKLGNIMKNEKEISLYYEQNKSEIEIDMKHIKLFIEFSNDDGPVDIRVWYLKNDYVGHHEKKKIIKYILCNLLDMNNMIDDYTDPEKFYDHENYKKYLEYQSINKKKSFRDVINENTEVET